MVRGLLAAIAATLGQACVAANAGYADVRHLTSDRLKKDVRWYEHDSSAAGEQRVRQLLAKPLNADGSVQAALLNNQGLQAEFEELGIARSRLFATGSMIQRTPPSTSMRSSTSRRYCSCPCRVARRALTWMRRARR
jgi:hypothetical protein